ncbi:MAG: bifunctional phosphoribosylaminoimidazolecarboxamide formyltransferase/IMP cyclohydrolase [Clostridiales bacterium]|nr:bifunctional phosphoribosylaminoimidazolecarboxamide formyltransferase/IMP cyclohydrolase [Clostridiales bacterium]
MRRAFLSLTDKRAFLPLVEELLKRDLQLVASSGTCRFLQERGYPCQDASEWTGFSSLLGGRVKTLHPALHAPLLARPEDYPELSRYGWEPFSVLAVDLYPFIRQREKGLPLEELVEAIDIGGVALLRAAAKNVPFVLPLCRLSQMPLLLRALDHPEEREKLGRRLAAEAFSATAAYDAAIAQAFRDAAGDGEAWPHHFILPLEKVADLRYGENPSQKGAWYRPLGERASGLLKLRQIQGGPLSYNNVLDAQAALDLSRALTRPGAVVIKHTVPCAVAVGRDGADALEKAYAADPVSIYGGIVALNRPLDGEAARRLRPLFLDLLLAPWVEEEALPLLRKKKLRLLTLPEPAEAWPDEPIPFLIRSAGESLLLQDPYPSPALPPPLPPMDPSLWDDLALAWQVVAHMKSNAIALVKGGVTVGLGGGQTSRIGAVQLALSQAGERAKGAVMASDGFFPFPDAVEAAAAAGIAAIIQPGGSLRDEAVLQRARELGIPMILTGTRHFRH